MRTIAGSRALAPRNAPRFLAVFGPGLVVMLADTDVGSIVTAGQSGAQWGYRLLLVQLLLVPVLTITQELTVRLALQTGCGHGTLICAVFGRVWGWVSVATLAIAVCGALLSEFSGVAAVGELYGVPRTTALPVAACCLLAVVLTRSDRRVEMVAIAVGLFELAFFWVAWQAHPDGHTMLAQAVDIPGAHRDYWYLLAANIGAAVAPWMIFYQQAAMAAKGLGPEHLTAARLDTALGAVLTQGVMAAVLIACAATLDAGVKLTSVGDLAAALIPALGAGAGRLVFSAGIIGAGMVAAIVASMALGWGVSEVAGFRAQRRRRFGGLQAACILGCAAIVAVAPDLVALNIAVQVVNALLLPVVLGLLAALSMRALPPAVRLHGWYRVVVVVVLSAATALGIGGGLAGAGLVPVP